MRTLASALLVACAHEESQPPPAPISTPTVCHDIATTIPSDEPRPEFGGRSGTDLVRETLSAYGTFNADLTLGGNVWPTSFVFADGPLVSVALLTSIDPEVCPPEPIMQVDVTLTVTGTISSQVVGRIRAAGEAPVTFSAGGPLEGPLANAAVQASDASLAERGMEPRDTEVYWSVRHDVSSWPEWAVPTTTTGVAIHADGYAFMEDFGVTNYGMIVASCDAPEPCLYAPAP